MILSYLGISIYAFLYSDSILFQPPRPSYRDAGDTLKIDLPTGGHISAVYLPNSSATYTLLYSHGNAEDLGIDRETLRGLREAGFSVFGYDYEGYGTSTGRPTEQATYQDEEAAFHYLTMELQVPADHIVAYGRSLGGAVAVDLASRHKLAGLVIESSFVSAYRVATRIPILPLDKFQSLRKLQFVHCPILVIHGTKDEVISFWHGEMLYRRASGPKMSLWIEGAGHNDLAQVAGQRYVEALRNFALLLGKESRQSP